VPPGGAGNKDDEHSGSPGRNRFNCENNEVYHKFSFCFVGIDLNESIGVRSSDVRGFTPWNPTPCMLSSRELSPTASTPVIVTGLNNSFSTAPDNMRDTVGIGLSMK
jgi:hypothetical protein